MKLMRARWYHKGRRRPIRLAVIHDMEWPETVTAAEDCARMFATMDRQASAHVCVDSDTAVRCVGDADTAWAAPGANADGLQVEIAGRARQSREEWLDPYSVAALGQAARVVAGWCKTYGIPVKRLTRGELLAGKKGIIGHIDATRAYGGSHTDPGPSFPWDTFLDLVNHFLKGDKPALSWTEELVKDLPTLGVGDEGFDVKTVRWLLGARGAGTGSLDLLNTEFTAELADLVKDFQDRNGLKKDGVVGAATWGKLLRI